jgi:hypothetical protein
MVKPSFRIQLHKKDYDLLVRIQTFFGVGNIIIDNNANAVHYAVYSLTDLTNVIIPRACLPPAACGRPESLLKIPIINSKTCLLFTF